MSLKFKCPICQQWKRAFTEVYMDGKIGRICPKCARVKKEEKSNVR